LTLTSESSCVYQGDIVKGKLSFSNRSKQSVERVNMSFVTIAIDSTNKSLSKVVNSTTAVYNLPNGTSLFNYSLQVPMTTAADVSESPLRIVNSVIVEFSSGKVMKKVRRIVLPVKVMARPANSKNAEEYLNFMKLPQIKITSYDEIPYGKPPKYDCVIPNGIETIYTKDGNVVEINHLQRDPNFLDYASSCMNGNYSVGYAKNIPFFIKYITSYVDYLIKEETKELKNKIIIE